ncbi:coiled-coil domain-containing protein 12 isoform X2 [Rhodamnia argentea]|uniref:Coiled-coil domain-containing protein 12 isoform X2 n=1 Tax=Rhodamnia argentea TaxID=178133 RepID=A0ABM3HPS1_9MYRT|nr:coiled-coil domain-containing protein 12 isoform X2 [Rhodamnia argentea]
MLRVRILLLKLMTNRTVRMMLMRMTPKRSENPSMKFRNYVPQDKQLQEGKVAPPLLPKFEDPVATEPPPAEKKDPFINIAPKKPNWDLRRDVQKKLDKLERRTQKAMYKIVQEQEKEKEKAEEDGENGASE